MDVSPLCDRELGTILSEENNRRFVTENPDFSVVRLLGMMEERMKNRIRFLSPEGEKDYLRKKLQQYRNTYRDRLPKKTIYEIYGDFLTDYERLHRGSIDLELHEARHRKGLWDIYDLPALLMIQYRITRTGPDEEFGQIFIDEAQDFGIAPYYALRKVLPECYFTIMGDVSQNINYETGMNDWAELRRWMLSGEKGYRSIAVICRDEREAEWTGKWLADDTVSILPVRLVKGLEFDVVLLWNQDMEKALSEPAGAKLRYVAATRALHELYVLQMK